jgi:hypothetical protein
MAMRIGFFITFVQLVAFTGLYSQVVVNPNYGLKSHETLEIQKIEISQERTIVDLTIENRIEKGSFCADRNIYLINPAGSRMKLLTAKGIPVCPDTFNFSVIGEKLRFTLEFPPLKGEIKWIDIIEDCASNCFWFYGVTLDNELNRRLDEAFSLASSGKPSENIDLFKSILDDIDDQNLGIEGLLFINIITASAEDNNNVNAQMWYQKLTASKAPRLGNYIKYLNEMGIKY